MNRPHAANQLAITFFYYRDLPTAMRFYEDILGCHWRSIRVGARSVNERLKLTRFWHLKVTRL